MANHFPAKLASHLFTSCFNTFLFVKNFIKPTASIGINDRSDKTIRFEELFIVKKKRIIAQTQSGVGASGVFRFAYARLFD